MVRGDPVAHLPGRPGALPGGACAAHGVQDAGRQGGVVPATRLVRQRLEAASEERLDPGAHGLLVLPQVAGDPRHAPARIREADHLQPIAGAGGQPGLAGALAQIFALLRCQHYSIHEPEHTRFYEHWPLTHVAIARRFGNASGQADGSYEARDHQGGHMETIVMSAASAVMEAFASLFRPLVDPAPIIAVQRLFGDNPFWLHLFRLVSKLGDAQAAALVVLLLFWFRQRRLAYALLVAVALAAITDVALWHLVNAPRPADPRIAVREFVTVSSFPSGHTMTAMALWGTLAAEDEIPWVVAVFLIGAVMLARLYLGVHFGRDLLGALLIGGAWIALRRRRWPSLVRRFSRLAPQSFLLPGVAVCVGALLALPVAPNGRWDILATIAGAAIGLALEYRFVRYGAAQASLPWTLGKLAIGLGGMATLYFAAKYAEDAAFPLAVGVTMLLPIWGFLLVPTLFTRLAALAHRIPARAVTESAGVR